MARERREQEPAPDYARLAFSGYGPELASNVQRGDGTGRAFVGDGIPWLDLAERESVIMIIANGCGGSDVDSLDAASRLEHQGVCAGINRPDQPRPGAHVRGGPGFIGGRGRPDRQCPPAPDCLRLRAAALPRSSLDPFGS
jgi:hypothetical protein